jgi:hypothetical protein
MQGDTNFVTCEIFSSTGDRSVCQQAGEHTRDTAGKRRVLQQDLLAHLQCRTLVVI